jgi:hypothetical protein
VTFAPPALSPSPGALRPVVRLGEANAKREQALAVLFYRSGWTQEELAKKEGKSVSWMSYRLVFGRFLNFSTNVEKQKTLPKNLTEGRFRSYWQQTDKSANERGRFIQTLDLMKNDLALRSNNRRKDQG